MSLSTLRYADTLYKECRCWYNASANLKHYRLKGLNLKYVVGSVVAYTSLPLRNEDVFMFGVQPNYKTGMTWKIDAEKIWKDYARSHAWLEDDDGNVYDYIFYGGHAGLLIEGVSKEELKKKNINYYPAHDLLKKFVINELINDLKTSVSEDVENEWMLRLSYSDNAVAMSGGEIMSASDILVDIYERKAMLKSMSVL